MTTEINGNIDLAYGTVVNIRPIPSRGVTRIEIEIPTESHVMATNMLFGQDAIVIPWPDMHQGGVTYGARKLGAFFPKNEGKPQALTKSGFGSMSGPLDYVKRAGIACREASFWRVLERHTARKIASEEDAITALRAMLQIKSRTELQSNVHAQRAFNELLSAQRAEDTVR